MRGHECPRADATGRKSWMTSGSGERLASRDTEAHRYGHQRGMPYGHSLWEFQVCGPWANPPPPPGPPPPPLPPGPQPPHGGTWAPGVFYPIGATVTYGGLSYRCVQAHTSQVTWEPP